MRPSKVFGALVFALLVLGATSASAFAATELRLTKGAYPQEFLGSSSHVSKLVPASGASVECESLNNKGTLNSGTDLLILLLFHKCKETAFGTACTSSGEPSGLIHTAVLALPVLLLTHVPGLLFQADKGTHLAEFTCGFGSVKVVVQGSVLGTITSPAVGVKSNKLTLSVEVTKPGTEQKYTHAEGSNVIDLLESSENNGAFQMATEEVTADESHFVVSTTEAEFVG